jgi:DNA-binding NtrC family response regulator
MTLAVRPLETVEARRRVTTRATLRILLADDQRDVVEALRLVLKGEGFTIRAASSPKAVLQAVADEEHDVVLMDLNYARDTTSGREGYELLDRLREIDPTLPVVVMTAWGTIEGAVEAVRRGARDYVQKPWDTARLVAMLRKEAEYGAVMRRARRLEGEVSRERAAHTPRLVAGATAMRPVLALLERVAPSDANILILGEHGTGKEVFARTLHDASARAAKPFVAVDAGGLSAGVFESELFGHVRGAFTDAKADRVGCFELADGGTLFLDEIGNMPVAQQAKLLRVLQTGEFHPVGSPRTRRADVRVVAATNVDILREVAEGRFREDLLYRLNTVEIHLPPLRERREDVLPLARSFLERFATKYGRSVRTFAADAERALREHSWPGNVRELEHAVERALLMAREDAIGADDLGLRSRPSAPPDVEALTLEKVELLTIQRALERANGNVNDAAVALGLSRSALYRRLQHHGLKGSG